MPPRASFDELTAELIRKRIEPLDSGRIVQLRPRRDDPLPAFEGERPDHDRLDPDAEPVRDLLDEGQPIDGRRQGQRDDVPIRWRSLSGCGQAGHSLELGLGELPRLAGALAVEHSRHAPLAEPAHGLTAANRGGLNREELLQGLLVYPLVQSRP